MTTYKIINSIESVSKLRQPKYPIVGKEYVKTVKFVKIVSDVVAENILNALCDKQSSKPNEMTDKLLNSIGDIHETVPDENPKYLQLRNIQYGVANAMSQILISAKDGTLPNISNKKIRVNEHQNIKKRDNKDNINDNKPLLNRTQPTQNRKTYSTLKSKLSKYKLQSTTQNCKAYNQRLLLNKATTRKKVETTQAKNYGRTKSEVNKPHSIKRELPAGKLTNDVTYGGSMNKYDRSKQSGPLGNQQPQISKDRGNKKLRESQGLKHDEKSEGTSVNEASKSKSKTKEQQFHKVDNQNTKFKDTKIKKDVTTTESKKNDRPVAGNVNMSNVNKRKLSNDVPNAQKYDRSKPKSQSDQPSQLSTDKDKKIRQHAGSKHEGNANKVSVNDKSKLTEQKKVGDRRLTFKDAKTKKETDVTRQKTNDQSKPGASKSDVDKRNLPGGKSAHVVSDGEKSKGYNRSSSRPQGNDNKQRQTTRDEENNVGTKRDENAEISQRKSTGQNVEVVGQKPTTAHVSVTKKQVEMARSKPSGETKPGSNKPGTSKRKSPTSDKPTGEKPTTKRDRSDDKSRDDHGKKKSGIVPGSKHKDGDAEKTSGDTSSTGQLKSTGQDVDVDGQRRPTPGGVKTEKKVKVAPRLKNNGDKTTEHRARKSGDEKRKSPKGDRSKRRSKHQSDDKQPRTAFTDNGDNSGLDREGEPKKPQTQFVKNVDCRRTNADTESNLIENRVSRTTFGENERVKRTRQLPQDGGASNAIVDDECQPYDVVKTSARYDPCKLDDWTIRKDTTTVTGNEGDDDVPVKFGRTFEIDTRANDGRMAFKNDNVCVKDGRTFEGDEFRVNDERVSKCDADICMDYERLVFKEDVCAKDERTYKIDDAGANAGRVWPGDDNNDRTPCETSSKTDQTRSGCEKRVSAIHLYLTYPVCLLVR